MMITDALICLLVTPVFLLIALVILQNLLCIVTVESNSMTPTLSEGDRLLVLRYWPRTFLHRGQIVVVWPVPSQISFNSHPKPFGLIPFIKRIVGLPGDTLVTYLNEVSDFHRPRLQPLHDVSGKRIWTIPGKHIFVRGDNIVGGFDSLSWGPIPFESIVGVVVLKLRHQKHAK